MEEFILGLAIGLVGGIAGGLLGVGGGIVFVPALVLLGGVDQHTAQGVSLAVIVPTAISGSLTNAHRGLIDGTVTRWVTPLALVAGAAGAALAGVLNAEVLTRIFGLVLVYAGTRTLLALRRPRAEFPRDPQTSSRLRTRGGGRRPPRT